MLTIDADKNARPSLAPGTYIRLLLVAYFEGLDSKRGIEWRAADSLGLRQFLRIGLDEDVPDHFTISRTRRLTDVETHRKVFLWVLVVLTDRGLLKGRTVGVDATTLEINAAMRSNRPAGQRDQLRGVPQEVGAAVRNRSAEPGRSGAAGQEAEEENVEPRVDQSQRRRRAHREDEGRKEQSGAQGRSRLHLKAGAVLVATLQAADRGDTATLNETLSEAVGNVSDPAERELKTSAGKPQVSPEPLTEIVADKGYHSSAIVLAVQQSRARSYIPEPQRSHRDWAGKAAEQKAVYANRRRMKGIYGKRLMKKRGELIERSLAHCYETGALGGRICEAEKMFGSGS